MKSLRAFLLNLCLKLASLFLSLARKLCGQSALPATREVFAQPAVALLLFAVISLLSSKSHTNDVLTTGRLVVDSRFSEVAVSGSSGDLAVKG
jgi:hypothetical protein